MGFKYLLIVMFLLVASCEYLPIFLILNNTQDNFQNQINYILLLARYNTVVAQEEDDSLSTPKKFVRSRYSRRSRTTSEMPPTTEPDTTLGPSIASEEIVANDVEQMASNSNITVAESTATNPSEVTNSTNVELPVSNGAMENKIETDLNSTNTKNSTTSDKSEITSTTEQSSTSTSKPEKSTTESVQTAANESDTMTWAEIEEKCGEKIGKMHPWIAILEHTDPKGQSHKKTVSKGVLIDKRHVLTTVSSVHNSRPFWTVYGQNSFFFFVFNGCFYYSVCVRYFADRLSD